MKHQPLGDLSAAVCETLAGSIIPNLSPKLARARVLLAEDEAMIALCLVDLLEAEGYEVTLAGDGAEALAVAQELGDAFDLLLTDLNMPKLGGEDLIRALRAGRPSLPVVVVTGSAPSGGAGELQRYGGGNGPLTLVEKPINFDELLGAIQRITSHTPTYLEPCVDDPYDARAM